LLRAMALRLGAAVAALLFATILSACSSSTSIVTVAASEAPVESVSPAVEACVAFDIAYQGILSQQISGRRRTGIVVIVVALVLGASACERPAPSPAPEETSLAETSPARSATETNGPRLPIAIRPFGGYTFFESAFDEAPVVRLKKHFEPSLYLALGASVVTKTRILWRCSSSSPSRPQPKDLAGEDRDLLLEDPAEAMLGSARGGEFEVMTIAGEEVLTAEGDAGVLYGWWYRPRIAGNLLGEDSRATEAFLTAYLAEANG
jgi:hypothetical protein